jgi:hypothetical protein
MVHWGKSELEKINFEDDLRTLIPRPLEEKKQIIKLTAGIEHLLMVDNLNQLWVSGENKYGCLGTQDGKPRNKPSLVPFFDNKRIIDFACGDKFSVVIAETFDLTPEEEKKYFAVEEMRANIIRLKMQNLHTLEAKDDSVAINSTKKDINCTLLPICMRGHQTKKVPTVIRNKVSSLLQKYGTVHRPGDYDIPMRA